MLVADRVLIDDDSVLEGRLDGNDTRLQDRLFVFRVVVLAVFGKVAVGTRNLDFFRYFFSFFAF